MIPIKINSEYDRTVSGGKKGVLFVFSLNPKKEEDSICHTFPSFFPVLRRFFDM